jgi:hypothetical protein
MVRVAGLLDQIERGPRSALPTPAGHRRRCAKSGSACSSFRPASRSSGSGS